MKYCRRTNLSRCSAKPLPSPPTARSRAHNYQRRVLRRAERVYCGSYFASGQALGLPLRETSHCSPPASPHSPPPTVQTRTVPTNVVGFGASDQASGLPLTKRQVCQDSRPYHMLQLILRLQCALTLPKHGAQTTR